MASVRSSRRRSPPRCVAVLGLAAGPVAAAVLTLVAQSSAAQDASATLYRVFLADGTSITSFGEFVRTGDRVVLSIPVGPVSSPTSLQLVSLPAGSIDWGRTDLYSDAVRSARYAATRGDADYTALTAEVARALGEVALAADPERKLALAVQARRSLREWPAAHFGYRAADVQELAAMLEEAVSSARAATGQRSFDLSLVAPGLRMPSPLLPAPTIEESLTSAAAAARVADVPAERLSLQQAVLLALRANEPSLPAPFAMTLRKTVGRELSSGLRDDREYRALATDAVRDAAARASDGDVRGVQRVIDKVTRQDAKLGRRRPQEILSIMAAVNAHMDAARERRLSLDRYAFRKETYADYEREILDELRALAAVGKDIEAVKAMAGPKPRVLPRLIEALKGSSWRLGSLVPPDDLRDVHAGLQSAVHLMSEAARMRREAVMANDLPAARNAASAAAGSLLLLAQAKSGIEGFFAPPGAR
jgi:hypothetical protein